VRDLAWLFLKLGTIAFGGPAAHVAMMEDEIVRRRGWLTRQEFLDLLGATNLIPGPNSTEMAIHVGRRRGGWRGLLVAGACFILPAALMTSAIAWGYVRFGALPRVEGILAGIKPVILAVVVQALGTLGRAALKSRLLAALAAAVLVANLLGGNEIALLFAAGAVAALARAARRGIRLGLAPWALAVPAAVAAPAGATPFALTSLFLLFLKVGSVLFGSGYVLLAFLRADLVERLRWMTDGQLLDAIAVGQMTPGPVFTTATFVGWVLGGPAAAAAATAGIFAPAFVFVAATAPFLPRLRRSPGTAALLDGVNAASLALMAAVTIRLAPAAVTDGVTALLALAALALLLRFRVNSAWLVLGGAIAGALR